MNEQNKINELEQLEEIIIKENTIEPRKRKKFIATAIGITFAIIVFVAFFSEPPARPLNPSDGFKEGEWTVTREGTSLSNEFRGTFSSKETENSKLKGDISVNFLQSEYTGIRCYVSMSIYEYEKHPVAVPGSERKYYDITVKADNGKKRKIQGYLDGEYHGSIMHFEDPDTRTLINALNHGYDVSFVVVEKRNPTTKYKFNVRTDNFAELYKMINDDVNANGIEEKTEEQANE